MNINYFKINRGLFVFSDPGGAKPLLSFIKINKLKDFKVISDRNYTFFSDFNINVLHLKNLNIEGIINEYKPDYIFTGTSYTSKIELRFLNIANRYNIDTYSYIDHYTNYRERFILNNKYIYPKKTILIDKLAENIAIKNNLHKNSELIIMNNYYYEFLRTWKPKTTRKKLIKNYKINSDNKVLVFAPDPISNTKDNKKYLFDEYDIWNDLADVLKKINSKKLFIVVKPHPNQDKTTLFDVVKKENINNVIFFDQENSIDLLFYSNIVVGMFSSILKEASVFKKKIIRHFPQNISEDPFNKLNLGLISSSKDQLYNNIYKYLYN